MKTQCSSCSPHTLRGRHIKEKEEFLLEVRTHPAQGQPDDRQLRHSRSQGKNGCNEYAHAGSKGLKKTRETQQPPAPDNLTQEHSAHKEEDGTALIFVLRTRCIILAGTQSAWNKRAQSRTVMKCKCGTVATHQVIVPCSVA